MKKNLLVIFLISIFAISACVSSTTRESTGEYLDSTAITTKVKASLVKDLGLGTVTKIEVSTYKGVVQLSGFVNSQDTISRAVNITKNVPGVVAVENSLLVKTNLK